MHPLPSAQQSSSVSLLSLLPTAKQLPESNSILRSQGISWRILQVLRRDHEDTPCIKSALLYQLVKIWHAIREVGDQYNGERAAGAFQGSHRPPRKCLSASPLSSAKGGRWQPRHYSSL